MSAKFEQIVHQNTFKSIVASAQAATFAQASKMDAFKTAFFSETAKEAATRMEGVSLNHARTPGFFSAPEASAIMAFASGRRSIAPVDAFANVNFRSSVLSTVLDAGSMPGARMGLHYKVASGTTPLDAQQQSRMGAASRALNTSIDKFRTAFAEARDALAKDHASAQVRKIQAEEDVIGDSAFYMAVRNDIASTGFDVSNFDKNAEQNNLLVLAVRRYELDPGRERAFTASTPRMTGPTAGHSNMSLN